MPTVPQTSPANQPGSLRIDGLPGPWQHAAWRRLAPEGKIALFNRHMAMMRELKTAGVKALHPDWSERRVQAEVARTYLHGRS